MRYGIDECSDEIRPNIQSANTEAEKQTSPTETTVQIVRNRDRPREKHEIFKLKRKLELPVGPVGIYPPG